MGTLRFDRAAFAAADLEFGVGKSYPMVATAVDPIGRGVSWRLRRGIFDAPLESKCNASWNVHSNGRGNFGKCERYAKTDIDSELAAKHPDGD